MPTTLERPKQKKQKNDRLDEIQATLMDLQEELQAIRESEPPKLLLPALHDKKTGRIDAQKVADYLAVPLKRFAEGLGLNYKAVHRDPSGESFQEALQPVKKTLEYLHSFYPKPEHQRIWLNTPHPLLDRKTGLEMILEGKAFATQRLLGNAWHGVWS